MALKRSFQVADLENHDIKAKKPKKAFTVGPANLPDGTHRRKGG